MRNCWLSYPFYDSYTGETECGYIMENAEHYFFECDNYRDSRLIMFRNTRNYHPLSLNTILYGKSTLNDDDNYFLFQAVQQYIKDTRRFV